MIKIKPNTKKTITFNYVVGSGKKLDKDEN
jgi:hypothetical protein